MINSLDATRNVGSGTLIGVDDAIGLVLTCAHLFADGQGTIVVEFAGRRRYGALLTDIDRTNDLALLRIRRPEVTPVQVAADDPSGRLVACGYGPNGRSASVAGRVVGYATPQGARHPSVQISAAVRPGDSGGGVFNTRGNLVGVVWGVRNRTTYATFGAPLRKFIGRNASAGGEGKQNPKPAYRNPKSHTSAKPQAVDQLATRWTEINRRVRTLEERMEDWPAAAELVTRDQLNGLARRDELRKFATAGQLADSDNRAMSNHHELLDRLKSIGHTATNEAKKTAVAVLKERLSQRDGLFQGISTTTLIAGALGLSGPLGIAVAVGLAALGRRWKKAQRRDRETHESNRPSPPDARPPAPQQPVAVDSPPLPQQTVPETRYVPYQRDDFAKAYQWSSEQVARKYPGAVEILSALDSLIKQRVNAT